MKKKSEEWWFLVGCLVRELIFNLVMWESEFFRVRSSTVFGVLRIVFAVAMADDIACCG